VTPLSGENWSAYFRDGRWDLRYYLRPGQRLQHRLPRKFVSSDTAKKYIERFVSEKQKRRGTAAPALLEGNRINPKITFQQFGELWTSGNLHKIFPRRVRKKKWTDSDESRLKIHVYPIIGNLELRRFKGADARAWCEEVLLRLPPPNQFSEASTRHVAGLINRLLNLAASSYIGLIPENPLKGYVPPIQTKRKKNQVYPSEDRLLMGNTDIPLKLRLLWGLLAREGCRLSELWHIQLFEFDLARGKCEIDETKNGKGKDWVMDPGSVRAIRRYVESHFESDDAKSSLFLDAEGQFWLPGEDFPVDKTKLALLLRGWLKETLTPLELWRPQLEGHGKSGPKARIPLRVHDLRGSFVTTKLAMGKTEAWCMVRTGHLSSKMLQEYRRLADDRRQTDEGDFVPLDEAIPELRDNVDESEESGE